MKKTILALGLGLVLASPALAAHPCAADAQGRAKKLLALHTEGPDGTVGAAKSLGDLKALKGKGRFDVLEVIGYVYKAEYRMRLIYAQINGSCLLMGQEILEAADPY